MLLYCNIGNNTVIACRMVSQQIHSRGPAAVYIGVHTPSSLFAVVAAPLPSQPLVLCLQRSIKIPHDCLEI